METRKMISLTLAALFALNGTGPAAATDYKVEDYLPLAVGNSWTYGHDYYYLSMSPDDRDHFGMPTEEQKSQTFMDNMGQFTIEVLREEVLGGQTYFVLSDLPADWISVPSYFIAGKKLRWAGTNLLERTADGERALYRFGESDAQGYAVPTAEGYSRVTSTNLYIAPRSSAPRYGFSFGFDVHGLETTGPPFEGAGCSFLAGVGLEICGRSIYASDYPVFRNKVKLLQAVIGGLTFERKAYESSEFELISTSTSSSSWGQVKQQWLAHRSEGRNTR